MLGQLGVVDKRVAVALDAIDCLVALDFLIAHGIQAGPFHQHVDGPRRESLVLVLAVVYIGAARPGRQFVLVAGHHVEIGAGQVALVLVVGLKDRTRVAGIGAEA